LLAKFAKDELHATDQLLAHDTNMSFARFKTLRRNAMRMGLPGRERSPPLVPFERRSLDSSMCARCKGAHMLCGKDRCPLLVKFYAKRSVHPLIDAMSMAGASPPGVFIGRFGYPKVFIGPLIPPIHGDTTLLDTPELWRGLSIDDIVRFRFSLVRGKSLADIHAPARIDWKGASAGKIVDSTRELAMAVGSIEVAAEFEKKPFMNVVMNDEVQPFGPSAPLRRFNPETVRLDHRIEKAFFDTDLKAKDAVISLYHNDTLVTNIQKSFSVGAFGLARNRRFVPTRWSITAVDSILSEHMMEGTRQATIINEYRTYEYEHLDNRWIVLMMPCSWRYELMEAWYPNTIWNPFGKEAVLLSDHEMHDGRKTYAEIGGCYYASRLAVNELLTAERRQAGVVVMRETHSGYIMPVGVWNVREAVRNALKQRPRLYPTLKDAMARVGEVMDIPVPTWIKKSGVLSDMLLQRRLDDFMR